MSDPLQFFTPIVGRMTHGSVTEKRTTDQDNRPIPEDKQRFEIGVAFPKADIWPWMTEVLYPYLATALSQDQNAFGRMQNWFQTLNGFSMKITDGDKANSKGQFNENTQGCFVFWFSAIEIKTAAGQSADALVEIDPHEVKRGYYVQVAGNLKPNDQPGDRAGIYMNANSVWLRAEGQVIAGGMDPTAAFAGAAPAVLPGGAQPYDPSGGAGGAFGGAPQPPGGMPGATQQPPAGMPGATQQPPAGMPGGAAPTQPPAQGQPQTAPAGMPGQGGMPGAAPGGTASPGEPQTQPHTGFMSGPPQTQR